MALIDDDGLERRCRELVASLELDAVSTVEDLARVVAAHLDLSIRLEPFPRPSTPDISGGCLVLDRTVVVSYPDRADRWYELVTVGHELGHLLCGHLALSASASSRAVDALLPDLQEAHRAWQLYRCAVMSEVREQEAELVGSFLVTRLERPRRSVGRTSAGRLAGLLGRRHPPGSVTGGMT